MSYFVFKVLSTPAVENFDEQNQLANETERLIKGVTKFLGHVIDDIDHLTTNLSSGGMASFQKRTIDVTFKVLGEVKKFIDKELDRVNPRKLIDAFCSSVQFNYHCRFEQECCCYFYLPQSSWKFYHQSCRFLLQWNQPLFQPSIHSIDWQFETTLSWP